MNTINNKFDADISKVLHLVINSIYTNKEIFLRELISNASDACNKLRYLEISKNEIIEKNHTYSIEINLNEKEKIISITDSGIGMNAEDFKEYLGTIAKSSIEKFQNNIKEYKKNTELIGQFGVGFYSSFMVAKKVEVISKKSGEKYAYKWSSYGHDSYSIEECSLKKECGTTVILHIKTECSNFLNHYTIKNIVNKYSDHINFPIKLISGNDKNEIINQVPALWLKTPKKISKEQYIEFYKKFNYQDKEPWLIIHNKIEGIIEYNYLIFIPGSKPFDLFYPDKKTGIKLYVNRVMISEDNNNIVPSYLRFLKGVVDSNDLPLNINRENLQDNHIIKKIKSSITKKVLSKLLEEYKKDYQNYLKFIKNFGEVIKEGLCQQNTEKEKNEILDICLFNSSSSMESLISLNEYISNMLEKQEKIYYFNGDNIDSMIKNPQLEGFKKRGIAVLLLTDNVDNIWINTVNKYKNKEFQSISCDNIDLDRIKNIKKKEITINDKEKQDKDYANLIKKIRDILGNKVKDVIISSKLVNSPACLSSPEGSMNLRMEKFLIDQKQIKEKSARILEINPNHTIWQNMYKSINNNNENIKLNNNLINVIYYQARLLEGDIIDNPSSFAEQINSLLSVVKS